jgi:hypothetical protein
MTSNPFSFTEQGQQIANTSAMTTLHSGALPTIPGGTLEDDDEIVTRAYGLYANGQTSAPSSLGFQLLADFGTVTSDPGGFEVSIARGAGGGYRNWYLEVRTRVVNAGATATLRSTYELRISQLFGLTGDSFRRTMSTELANVDTTQDLTMQLRAKHSVASSLVFLTPWSLTVEIEEAGQEFEPFGAVDAAISALLAGADPALDSFNELATRFADDEDIVAGVLMTLAGKSDIGHNHDGRYDLAGAAANVATLLNGTKFDKPTGTPSPGYYIDYRGSWQPLPVVSGGGSSPQGIVLDSFATGGTDDQKLSAAMSYAAAATYPPPILGLARRYGPFTQKGRALYEGFSLIMPGGDAFQEGAGGASGRHSEWSVNFDSSSDGVGQFHATDSAQVRNCHFENVNVVGAGSRPAFLTQVANDFSITWWMLSMQNITSSLLWGLIGTAQFRLLLTLCDFGGRWNVNNSYETAIRIGGSDNTLWPSGNVNIDSPPSTHPATGAGRPLLWFEFMGKTTVGGIFITGEDKWLACRVDGPDYNKSVATNAGDLEFYGAKFEGRNPTQAAFGAVYQQRGATTAHYGCRFAQGMEATATAARGELGVVHVKEYATSDHSGGGHMELWSPKYDRAASQAESVPFIYATDAATIVRPHGVRKHTRGGIWSGNPQVKVANGATVPASDGSYAVV